MGKIEQSNMQLAAPLRGKVVAPFLGTLAAGACLLFATSASAVPLGHEVLNAPQCDPIGGSIKEELGWGQTTPLPPNPFGPPFDPAGPRPFPPPEEIASTSFEDNIVVCADPTIPQNDPALPDYVVDMINMTTRSYGSPIGDPVYFVADRDNAFRNFDGFIGGGLAMEIDFFGINRPLIAESMALDGVWAPGETWRFVVEDWIAPSGMPPHIFNSAMCVGACSFGFPPSTASIVANVPEPGVAAVLGLALAGLGWRRRSKAV